MMVTSAVNRVACLLPVYRPAPLFVILTRKLGMTVGGEVPRGAPSQARDEGLVMTTNRFAAMILPDPGVVPTA